MTNDNEPKTFEEAFQCYIKYRRRFEQLENEFDEYQQSSLNYEEELEIQSKQLDNQIHHLQQDLFIERTKNEQYRERSEQTIKQFDKHFDQIQDELNACKNLNNKFTHYIRELEQTNDDLERSKRALLDSLSTFETQLNRALEQNALLENELDEKQQLTETVQRLRDETRDLHEELDVLHKTNNEKPANSNEMPIINSNRMQNILSEAAAAAAATAIANGTSTNDFNTRQDLPNGDYGNTLSTPKYRTVTTAADLQISKGYDFYQPLSKTTRLESLKLITEAFRRFIKIESTLSTQRRQSQTALSVNSNRSRYNSATNSNYNKPNELIRTQTQS